MDLDNLDNCSICLETYGDDVRPRSLTCGHSFCTSCLDSFIENKNLVCPLCQRSHPASFGHDFPINYGMEQMISNLRMTQLPSAPTYQSGATSIHLKEHLIPNPPHQSGSISSKMSSFIQEQRDNTQILFCESQMVRSGLDQYKNFLLERKAKHEDLYLQVMDLANRNKEIVKKMTTEYEKVTKIQKEGAAIEDIMKVNLQSLVVASTAQTALAVIDEHDKSYAALEEWTKNCQKPLPNASVICSSERIMIDTTAAMSMVTREEEEEVMSQETLKLSQSPLPVIFKLGKIRQQTFLTLKSLYNMSETMNTIIANGGLYAVQKQVGRIRSARVTMTRNQMYLHHLQDGEPPLHTCVIQHSDLIGTLNNDSVVAFMDLAWEGCIQGRIYILLSPETAFGHQFRILCTGDFGPCYARTRFLKVEYKGMATERVKGGDYEHNDGSGGAPLIRELDMNEKLCRRKLVAGLVWAKSNKSDRRKSAQFMIATGKGFNMEVHNVFGHVKEGLDLVKEAAKQEDIGSVTIADCGIVLPL